ncbi:MAG TPA: 16S rRNA (guanine(527)-N(7))-methyltransferase RsmG [Bacteroidales bacterium]|nr:16S rRNA (guanine(527)-N(7))-methyltransferase RsmG [Bacteroidales bacterium]HNY53095.1 16S rRNA (guanine(527)-N(7))-methyltransferase RsmG [Bacteroidales bacterium]HOG57098.1 16S rRNA (guanine(527)-N(7))-methyltransferase RsmG [Bacteroidales bacterium]HPB13151.1 16S rRNA (guanine(527)-N(7))-methyltransferase RsmG [Bacteroidales bacterium]HPX43975.1 16S rRNA (guanine(527)-N(7))-methyltransferase RsmG [Bacteroidales bacterium]
MSEIIRKYFPELTGKQFTMFSKLGEVYRLWNDRINVISRKDFDNFYTHHVLHSLSIAKICRFSEKSRVLDVGTGGGFPGIPLAIMFPNVNFFLLDSIAKKIKVVSNVAGEIGLENVIPLRKRIEEEKGRYNFIVSRAVMPFPELVKLTGKNIIRGCAGETWNGIICLKGGDLSEELMPFRDKVIIHDISAFFSEPWFVSKKIVCLPL